MLSSIMIMLIVECLAIDCAWIFILFCRNVVVVCFSLRRIEEKQLAEAESGVVAKFVEESYKRLILHSTVVFSSFC